MASLIGWIAGAVIALVMLLLGPVNGVIFLAFLTAGAMGALAWAFELKKIFGSVCSASAEVDEEGIIEGEYRVLP